MDPIRLPRINWENTVSYGIGQLFKHLVMATPLLFLAQGVWNLSIKTDVYGDPVYNTDRCMPWDLKLKATLVGGALADEVSGWYGPGAYIAWLLTAYFAAVSSIWHAKTSDGFQGSPISDGCFVTALVYPIVAFVDIARRLICCHIDPSMDAAFFVILNSALIIGPAARLSWQHDSTDDHAIFPFPSKPYEWFWKSVQFLNHLIIWVSMSEPYAPYGLIISLYLLLLVVLLCAEIRVDVPHWYQKGYLPRVPRVGIFCLVQFTYGMILIATERSLLPVTGVRFSDMDQVGTLVVALIPIATRLYLNRGHRIHNPGRLRCNRGCHEAVTKVIKDDECRVRKVGLERSITL